MSKVYDRVALIGLGLIASSIFWASKRNDVSSYITGFARSKETRDTAKKIGLCDEVFDTVEEAVKDADLVILCVPVGAMEQVMLEIAPFLKTGATISDVGSVKRAVIDAVEPHLPTHVKFVPAGTNFTWVGKCGSTASITALFTDPTSLIVAPVFRNGAISNITCSIAPTGTHKITKSASLTASSTVSKTSSQRPIFFAVSRVSFDRAKPVM